jgi:hypothetical protein
MVEGNCVVSDWRRFKKAVEEPVKELNNKRLVPFPADCCLIFDRGRLPDAAPESSRTDAGFWTRHKNP